MVTEASSLLEACGNLKLVIKVDKKTGEQYIKTPIVVTHVEYDINNGPTHKFK